ncbi:methyl-CpG-binding domain protein 6 isoform X9 [Phalacrocorax carbo]|uniref:methyl-CpG-binding domain protein 6 isoform X9 n=1 Tax=Phalacrocorax carbo TaxID=9209 RepID=UPI003119B9B3
MSSSDDCTRREQPTCPLAGPVPVGWERKVEEGSVCYIRVPLVYLPCPRYPMHLLVMPVQTQMFPVYLQSSLASPSSPSVVPTSTGTPAITTEAPCREGRAPNSPMGTLEHLNLLGPHLGSSLLSAVLLGNLLPLSPLLQHCPLLLPTLSPLGLLLGLGQGSQLGTTSPLARLLQSLQGNSLCLCPSCQSWRRKASTPQPSSHLETLQRRGLSTNLWAGPTVSGDRDTGRGVGGTERGRETGVGASTPMSSIICTHTPPQVDVAVAWCPWPGCPVNCQRKLLT